MKHLITVQTTISEGIEKVWEHWTNPEHIVKWNFATPEWHCPAADHDLKIGGELNYKMAAKDGSMSFDYKGKFTQIKPKELLEYTLEDDRKVSIKFHEENGVTSIVESFEAEDENTIDLQRQGWQSILNNFKHHVESKSLI